MAVSAKNAWVKRGMPVRELTTGLEFKSLTKAGEYFGICPATIRRVLLGKTTKMQANLIFEWVK